MSKNVFQSKILRNFEEMKAEKCKGFLIDNREERPKIKECAEDESLCVSTLKKDCNSVKSLQKNATKAKEKLKHLGPVTRTLSQCRKTPKCEKRLKKENNEIFDVRKLRKQCNRLNALLKQAELENQELILINTQLKGQIKYLSEPLSDFKTASTEQSARNPELAKYAQFISKRLNDLPKWEELFIERFTSMSAFLSQISRKRFEACLLHSLQFISDIFVYSLNKESPKNPFDYNKDSLDECDEIFNKINDQSDRIVKLNKQISEAMLTSKELLYSPLSKVIKREQPLRPGRFLTEISTARPSLSCLPMRESSESTPNPSEFPLYYNQFY